MQIIIAKHMRTVEAKNSAHQSQLMQICMPNLASMILLRVHCATVALQQHHQHATYRVT